MERKTNFCSCRLAAQHETGRVRWCVGRERDWQTKLKRLIYVPIVLIPIVITVVILARYGAKQQNHESNLGYSNTAALTSTENLDWTNEGTSRNILKDANTIYVQSNGPIDETNKPSRKRRELQMVFNEDNSTDNNSYEENVLLPNNSTSDDYVTNLETNTLQWKKSFNIDKQKEQTIFWKNKLDYEQIRILQAITMKKYMNASVNPCDDFYEFACGSWKKYHSIPADRASYDTFEMLRENLDIILRDLLTETESENFTANSSLLHDATDKAKFFYKSCMNEEKLEQRGDGPLLSLLDELGGWPIISPGWNETNFDFELLMAQLKLFNNDILITEWIGPDIINSKNYIIQIDQTTLGLPGRGYFLEPSYAKYLDAYRTFIISTATLLGSPLAEATKDVDDIIKFEKKIAQIMVPSEDRRNVTDLYLRTSVGSLLGYFSEFDWIKYFSLVLGREANLDDAVACYCMEYLYNLIGLLKKTPARTIANYLLWRFVRHRTNNLDDRFLIAKQTFYQVLFGREQSPPRWQFCVSQVNSNMGMALGSMFVKKYFDENSKNDTLEMTKRLQEAFRIILEENIWLGDQTKDYARMKIDKMNLKIGYPDFLLDKAKLNKRYHDLDIHPDYFFENILSNLRHLTRSEQFKIGSEVDKTAWGTAPAVVNAYYSRNKNQIIFPAGILQPPFYHKFFPKSLNFGGIGVVIGHEITHGFDDKGRLFDQYGNLQQWWKEDSIFKFQQRAKCMIDQYNSYVVPDVDTNMDGFITQGENIADNGGLKQAFRAYEMWHENNPDADETLPGLNLTGKQLFFLNFAQIWCGKQRIDTVKSRLKVAVHSPGIFRVIGTLSNSEDFARIFNCPLNSVMNPTKKCSLW